MSRFKRIVYPDGQISAQWKPTTFKDEGALIKERINSYEDLFFVRAIADVLQYHKLESGWKLFIPCMFGQRSDRRFDRFQSFDLKLIADIINECRFREVQILDPHSDVSIALINNAVKVSAFNYVKQAVDSICKRNEAEHNYSELPLLVSPDAGAYKKVFEFGEKLGCEVMGAMKHRDKEGKIDLMFTHDVEGKECLIVDDLCDGGYTFELLGKQLKEMKASRVYLYVTHGIFSKGFVNLIQAGISHVYCTNSVRDIEPDVAQVYRTSQDMYPENAIRKDYVTQYNVI